MIIKFNIRRKQNNWSKIKVTVIKNLNLAFKALHQLPHYPVPRQSPPLVIFHLVEKLSSIPQINLPFLACSILFLLLLLLDAFSFLSPVPLTSSQT